MKHKHVFTFCAIAPQRHATGSWNPLSCKTRVYLFYIVNIMAADDGDEKSQGKNKDDIDHVEQD